MKSGRPTSFDIAYRAGVSQPTVSRALRNSPLVNKETRDKIQAIAKELNYKVDINARNLRSQSAKTIALLVCEDPFTGDSLINPFFLSMLGSITKESAIRGYDLLISFQQDSDDWAADYENTHRADGIIFLGYGDYTTYTQRITLLEELNAHFITWGQVLKNQPGKFIGCDNTGGAYSAVKHLLDHGRQRIAFLGENTENSPEFKARYDGYSKAHAEAGIQLDASLIEHAIPSESSGYAAAKRLLQKNSAPDAIFAASDLIALGAIKYLNESNISIPDDIAIVGFDDIPLAAYSTPSLTTIRQDTIHAGKILVENLIQLIEGNDIQSQQISGELVKRQSCGCA